MGKAVLMSILPEYCSLIAGGKKTVEARKDYPRQAEPPFRCYIYCTIGSKTLYRSCIDGVIRLYHKKAHEAFAYSHHVLNGKVIGEYVCDKLVWVVSHPGVFAGHDLLHERAIKNACLTIDEAERYAGGKNVYGWSISQLLIYDRPKELRDFGLLRPPQSWCYVEDK